MLDVFEEIKDATTPEEIADTLDKWYYSNRWDIDSISVLNDISTKLNDSKNNLEYLRSMGINIDEIRTLFIHLETRINILKDEINRVSYGY